MQQFHDDKIKSHLFKSYYMEWNDGVFTLSENNKIELNFEKDYKQIVKEILPILKYKAILEELQVSI